MTIENFSYLAVVTATVLFLVALMAHAAEWAYARGLSAVPVGEDDDGHDRDHRARLQTDSYGRMGIGVTVLGTAALAAGVVARGIAAHRAPWGNMYEFVTAALLFVSIAYLVGVWRLGLRWLGVLITLLLVIGNGLAVTVFHVRVAPLVPALHSVWFVIHIVAACIAAAAFNVGGLASILYLVKSRAERRALVGGAAESPHSPVGLGDEVSTRPVRSTDVGGVGRPTDVGTDEPSGLTGSGGVALASRRRSRDPVQLKGFLARIPSVADMDTLAYRANAFGFPVWTFTVAAGSIWAEYAWGRFWGWDPKETWALITWVIYACYLHARATSGWKGSRAAWIAVAGVASFWFNFVGINLLVSGLHSYAGI